MRAKERKRNRGISKEKKWYSGEDIEKHLHGVWVDLGFGWVWFAALWGNRAISAWGFSYKYFLLPLSLPSSGGIVTHELLMSIG